MLLLVIGFGLIGLLALGMLTLAIAFVFLLLGCLLLVASFVFPIAAPIAILTLVIAGGFFILGVVLSLMGSIAFLIPGVRAWIKRLVALWALFSKYLGPMRVALSNTANAFTTASEWTREAGNSANNVGDRLQDGATKLESLTIPLPKVSFPQTKSFKSVLSDATGGLVKLNDKFEDIYFPTSEHFDLGTFHPFDGSPVPKPLTKAANALHDIANKLGNDSDITDPTRPDFSHTAANNFLLASDFLAAMAEVLKAIENGEQVTDDVLKRLQGHSG